MMNTRGNTFSRGHNQYSNLDPRYWAFSTDEMALQDLPATIDYLLKANGGHKKVSDESTPMVTIPHLRDSTVSDRPGFTRWLEL